MFLTVRLKCQGKLIMHVKGKLYSLNDYIRLHFEILMKMYEQKLVFVIICKLIISRIPFEKLALN